MNDWPDHVADALDQMIRRAERGELHDQEQRPPLATFDFDNTCIAGDIGQVAHFDLAENFYYALDNDAFWGVIGDELGGLDLQAEWREVREMAPEEREESERARQFGVDLIATYSRRRARLGVQSAYDWACRLHVGLSPEFLRRHGHNLFMQELERPMEVLTKQASCGMEITLHRGIRIRPAMFALLRRLQEAGFEVWIISATNQWTIDSVGPIYGVSPDLIVGNRCTIDSGLITDVRQGPTTWRAGKVTAIDQYIGRRPAFAIGDTWTDMEMLDAASELAILIDGGDAELQAESDKRGWMRVAAEAFTTTKQLPTL